MICSCDPGVDDALALALLAAWPDLGLEGVVAQGGNVPLEFAVRNAAGLVAAFGLRLPVARGSAAALSGPFPGHAADVHGDDGLGGASGLLPPGPAVTDDGPETIAGVVVATGPLTDVALALAAGRPVTRIVWMGGSLREGGNVTRHAEFNAWCDPAAAGVVFAAGVPVEVVPLDVTHRVRLHRADLDRFGGSALVAAIAGHLVTVGGHLHDPVAVVAARHAELFGWEGHTLECVPEGERQGETVSLGSGPIRVATTVAAEPVHDLIVDALDRITRLSFSS